MQVLTCVALIDAQLRTRAYVDRHFIYLSVSQYGIKWILRES